MAFLCSRLSWRRDYLEHIKIIVDQAPLDLRLEHNEQNSALDSSKLYRAITIAAIMKLHSIEAQKKFSQSRSSHEQGLERLEPIGTHCTLDCGSRLL
ncbi:unnamed protein product [Spirodela intermedia]|uniref:Uncharacterized protein n=1 Tax=Spirodela intermedia TaxID=51605 RepID=A0A7I8KBG7_SPIIN|nr:unnamed protein product [Spirodela intermedia]